MLNIQQAMLSITKNDIEIVHNLFSQITPIPASETKLIASFLKKAQYKKDEKILNLGQTETRISLVTKGMVHMFTYIDGEEFTINISLPGMIFNSLDSYIYSTPANEIQIAIADAEILFLNKNDVEHLLQNNIQFSYVYNKLYEFALSEREQRTLLLQYNSAFKRFEHFMQNFSIADYYLQKVPQKLIAQYLGMAPETLCRVKNLYFKQNRNCNE